MTKNKLAYFWKRLKYWQRELSLLDHELLPVSSEDLSDESATQRVTSDVMWHYPGRWAKVRIEEECEDTNKEIDKIAFHEMCELRLAKLRDMAGSMYSWDVVDNEIHTVIRTFENLLFK